MKPAIQQQMDEDLEENQVQKAFETIFLLAQENNTTINHTMEGVDQTIKGVNHTMGGVIHLGTLEKAVYDFHPLYKSADCYIAGKVNYLNYTSELESDTKTKIKDSQNQGNLLYVFSGFGSFNHLDSNAGHYTAFFEVFSVPKIVIDAVNGSNVLKLKKHHKNYACLKTLDNKVIYEELKLTTTTCMEA